MNPALLIACFALVANAAVIDDITAKFHELQAGLEKVAAEIKEKGEAAIETIKENIDPALLAELDVFHKLCPEHEKQVAKRDLNEHVQSACKYINENWPKVEAKVEELKTKAKVAFDKFAADASVYYGIIQKEAAEKWEKFSGLAKGTFEKAKEQAKITYDSLSAKFDTLSKEAQVKLEELRQKAGPEWEKFKEQAKNAAEEAKTKLDAWSKTAQQWLGNAWSAAESWWNGKPAQH